MKRIIHGASAQSGSPEQKYLHACTNMHSSQNACKQQVHVTSKENQITGQQRMFRLVIWKGPEDYLGRSTWLLDSRRLPLGV